MDGVTAEIAQEIAVFLQHGDGHPGPGQKQSEHHAGWTPADHAARCVVHVTPLSIIVEFIQWPIYNDPRRSSIQSVSPV
jgi:hypothetical protein